MEEIKKSHSVNIASENVYNSLQDVAKKNNISLRSLINNLLKNVTEAENFLTTEFSHLEKIGQKEDVIYLKDNSEKEKGKMYEVNVEDKRLQCSECPKGTMCDHITYAIIDPEFWGITKQHSK